jgi:hypothetical protein
MTARRLSLAAAIILLTMLGYFFFPGHTYLQQDTQIYVPILEHLWDSSVLAKDMVAVRHHVTFTIYDEMALAVRRLSGLGFKDILVSDELVFRALGILGVYLIATGLKLSRRMALIVAAVYALGATIAGPSVLTVEYEPKPRGSAVAAMLLAVGLVAHGRYIAGGVAASIAFLYHPPTVCPYWAVYFALTLWPSRPEIMGKRIRGLIPLACAAALLFVFSRLQIGGPEPQPFLSQVDPSLEQLQRMRAPYNWVSMWIGRWIWHYLFLWLISVLAFLRLRKFASTDLRFFLVGLPLVGMLSVPATHLLLEQWKWSLMPKFQPARALLFVVAIAVILAAAAAIHAARQRHFPEGIAWGILAFAIPVQTRVSELLLPHLGNATIRRRVLMVIALSVLTCVAAWLETRRPKAGWLAWAAALLAPFFLIPYYGGVKNYPTLRHPELTELAEWARTKTAKDAVFLFPDSGKGLDPGIFRSTALRAVYVDWKGGGQVNMVKEFGEEWWARWQQAMAKKFAPSHLDYYAALGIDYIVLNSPHQIPGRSPVYANATYIVYRITPSGEKLPLPSGSERKPAPPGA